MKGPPRPHTAQTSKPPLARPRVGSSKCDSGKVGTPTPSGEDGSVTIDKQSRFTSRSRYVAWRSA